MHLRVAFNLKSVFYIIKKQNIQINYYVKRINFDVFNL